MLSFKKKKIMQSFAKKILKIIAIENLNYNNILEKKLLLHAGKKGTFDIYEKSFINMLSSLLA